VQLLWLIFLKTGNGSFNSFFVFLFVEKTMPTSTIYYKTSKTLIICLLIEGVFEAGQV
jgi:hypothetical protein